MPKYPKLDPAKLPTQAEHGVLGQLDGEWVNKPGHYGGIHTTIMPAPGTTSEQMFGAFHFKTDEYKEELKFTKKDGPVRNRFGSNEQFVGAVNYETNITARSGEGLHFEVGQYLWLGVWTENKTPSPSAPGAPPSSAPYNNVMYSRQATEADVKNDLMFPTLGAGAQGPQFLPPFSISRQGSIPHGNSIQLFGNQPVRKQPKEEAGIPHKDIVGPPEIYPGANEGVTWDANSVAFHPTMGYTAKQLNKATNPDQPHLGSREKPSFAKYCTPDAYAAVALAAEAEASGDKWTEHLNKEEFQKAVGKDVTPVKFVNSGPGYMGRIFNGAQKTELHSELFPYCVQPNFKLVDNNKKLVEDGYEIVKHDKFTLNTQIDGPLGSLQGHQGGSLNTVGTERYCKVQNMRFTMWISQVRNKATGETHDELQYEQVIHFQFGFGTNATKTLWPHIQCNTLIRKPRAVAEVKAAEAVAEAAIGKRSRNAESTAGTSAGTPDSIRTHLKSTAQACAGQGASVKVEEQGGLPRGSHKWGYERQSVGSL
eukprot:CAMPEP_0118846708 /NCGR_PEP_ID=MMETSP1162-20130426/92579_1 /TAXON_ID=33656 /ORGANISM="Phaeocystis Sp, Strain CCMP2710" /LENGTH=536 /DNA_ID=CAMNT_0006778893 /DNA_START=695 /DNA_END=2306 /DNA_ORIENTATION=+